MIVRGLIPRTITTKGYDAALSLTVVTWAIVTSGAAGRVGQAVQPAPPTGSLGQAPACTRVTLRSDCPVAHTVSEKNACLATVSFGAYTLRKAAVLSLQDGSIRMSW